jgi:5-methylcytosine-specific restriction endonuclease McrA
MRRLVPAICAGCQTPFMTRNKDPKFCSSSCAAKVNNVIAPKRQAMPKRPCEICGTPTARKRFCSRDCTYQGQQKYATEEERWKADRAIKNEAWQRYMARRRDQTPADVDIEALQEIYLTCPEGYEVDHKVPISKGGLHCPSNLQHLPMPENRRKGAKLLPQYQ